MGWNRVPDTRGLEPEGTLARGLVVLIQGHSNRKAVRSEDRQGGKCNESYIILGSYLCKLGITISKQYFQRDGLIIPCMLAEQSIPALTGVFFKAFS